MKIAIGSDHAGLALKEALKAYLDSRMIPYEDFGTHTQESCDYPRIAEIVCNPQVCECWWVKTCDVIFSLQSG